MAPDMHPLPVPPPTLAPDPKATWNPSRPSGDEELTVFQGDHIGPLSQFDGWDLESGRQTGPGIPGAFTLKQRIGQGGQGEVWEAHQVSLQRVMALKRIRREWLQDPQTPPERVRGLAEAFRREALTMALLDHPGVLPIFDFWEDDEGHPILSMKRIQGSRWEQALAADYVALPYADHLARHLAVLEKVAQTVAFAHSRGILHRDLKPAQVMLGSFGEVWLLDWGLAAAFQEGVRGPTPVADAPTPAGTPAYMAPEQTRSNARNLGPWTDVYLLGGLLYEILVGAPPHGLGSSSEAFLRAAKGLVDPLALHRPTQDWPEDLAGLALEALASDPTQRPPSAQAFLERLTAHLSGRSRRQLAETWVQEAVALQATSRAHYGVLSQALALLHRAQEAWPDHPQAAALRRELLTHQARLALGQGDLGLAENSAFQVPAGPDREALLAEVERHRQIRARHHRTRTRALAASGLLTLALTGVGGKAYFDQRRAVRRHQAQHQRAEALTGFMLEDLRAALEPVGRLDLLRDVVQRVLAYYEALPAQDRTPAEALRQVKALRQVAEVLANQNDSTQATKALASATALVATIPATASGDSAEPALLHWTRGTLAALEGRPQDALRDMGQAAAEFRRLLALRPTPVLREHVAHLALAVVEQARRQNDLASAQTHLEEASAQLAALQAQGPPNLALERLAFEVTFARAEVSTERSQYAVAETSYRKAADIMVAILGRHPDFLPGRGRLAELHQRLGDLLSLTARKPEGMREYQTALTWARAACTLDPGRSVSQDHLGLLLNRVAQLHLNDRRAAAAIPLLTESRELYLRLAAANPSSQDWISRLAYVEGLLGWSEREQHHNTLSLQYFEQGVARLAQLCSLQPDQDRYRLEWAIQLIEYGVALNLVGQKPQAEKALHHALDLLKVLRAKSAHPVQAELMAEAYVHLGQPQAAKPWMEECLKAGYMVDEVRALARKAKVALP